MTDQQQINHKNDVNNLKIEAYQFKITTISPLKKQICQECQKHNTMVSYRTLYVENQRQTIIIIFDASKCQFIRNLLIGLKIEIQEEKKILINAECKWINTFTLRRSKILDKICYQQQKQTTQIATSGSTCNHKFLTDNESVQQNKIYLQNFTSREIDQSLEQQSFLKGQKTRSLDQRQLKDKPENVFGSISDSLLNSDFMQNISEKRSHKFNDKVNIATYQEQQNQQNYHQLSFNFKRKSQFQRVLANNQQYEESKITEMQQLCEFMKEKYKQLILEKDQFLNEMKESMQIMKEQFQDLITEKNQRIEQYQQMIAEKDQRIEQYQQTIAERDKKLNLIKQNIKEKKDLTQICDFI